MEAAMLAAQSTPESVLPMQSASSGNSDPGTITDDFAKLLNSLSGGSKTLTRNSTGDQAEGSALLLSLLQVLPGSLPVSTNTGGSPDVASNDGSSGGRDPTVADNDLSSIISQLVDSLEGTANTSQSDQSLLSALTGLAGNLQDGQAVAGSTGLSTNAGIASQLNAALNAIADDTGAGAANLLAALEAVLGQGSPDTSNTTGSGAIDPLLAGSLSSSPDNTSGASGSQAPAKSGGDQSTGSVSSPGAKAEVAASIYSGSTPGKTGGDQAAPGSVGPDPKVSAPPDPAQSAATASTASTVNGSTQAKSGGGQPAQGSDQNTPARSGAPPAGAGTQNGSTPKPDGADQPQQAPGISGSKESPIKDASFVKPGGPTETQQVQTQTSQSPSNSGETPVLLASSLQQHNLSSTTGLEQIGQGQATDSESGTLGANAIRQIVSSAQLLVNNNNASMSIQLKPEFLGSIRLVVDVEQGIVNAHFIAQNQATANLIQSRLPELKQALSDQGISWQHLDVSSGGNQGNQQGASSQSQQQDTGPVEATGDYAYPDNADSEAQFMTPAAYQWAGAGTFNYVV